MALRLLFALALVLLLSRTAAAALPDGHWQLVSHAVPASLAPGARVEVEVRLQNRTSLTWSEERQDRLAYHWRAEDGSVLEWDGRRTHLPAPLPPGESVTLQATIEAPSAPGRYYLQFEPVREHKRWWGAPSFTRDVVIAVEVVATDARLAWSIDQPAPLPRLAAGAQVLVPLRLHNVGDAPWSPAASDRLSYHWIDGDGRRIEGIRTPLPGPAPPGATVELTAQLLAPPTPGAYTLEWEPVREHLRWFGPPRTATPTITAIVGPSRDRVTIDPPLAEIHARTASELDVIVVNHGDTWPEAHGLALSYHWHTRDGALVEYDGLRTPLPALARGEEALVTARVQGPEDPGEHQLEWALVRDGVGWYAPEPPVTQPVTVQPPLLGWELRAVDWPWTLPVGREETVRVRVHNTGLATLSPRTADRLSYRWHRTDGSAAGEEGLRSELPADLPPGASTSVLLRIAGPPRAGTHMLELGLVREHVAWAPDPAGLPNTAAVLVVRRSDLAQISLVLLTLAAIVLARRRRLGPAALRRLPALWSWAATLTLSLAFADLAALPPWSGGLAPLS